MRPIALLLLCSLAASAETAKPEELSSIEGRVLNAATGEPVGKASLLLMRADSTQALSQSDWMRSYGASSDAAGKFIIQGIAPGKYRLKATRNGFVSQEYGARSSQRSGTVLDIGTAQQQKDIDLRLTPGGVVAGRVLDAEGEPLATAQVQLLRSRYVNGKRVLSMTNTEGTNDLGEYRWSGLTPGRYYIYVENLEVWPPVSSAREEYVPVYYPGATNLAGSIPIDVAAGAQVRAMDIILRKAPAATVKGKVLIELQDVHGTPEVTFEPQLGHDRAGASHRMFWAKVDASGGFEARGLPPGTYTVGAGIAMEGRGFNGRTTVDVDGADIEGVVVVIGSGVSATGRISVDGETKQDFQNASIRLRRGGPTVDSVLLAEAHRIAKDHTFKLEELDPDRYGFLIDGLPNGFYTKSISAGGVDVTYSGVDLTSGSAAPIDILVSPRAGLVSGAALNPDSNPPTPGATVVLVPKEKERLAIFEFYQQAATDQNGRFTFRNVVPGEYNVYAWEDVESGVWMDPEFMKPLEDKGEAVKVEESAQANVQVTIIPADSEKDKLQ